MQRGLFSGQISVGNRSSRFPFKESQCALTYAEKSSSKDIELHLSPHFLKSFDQETHPPRTLTSKLRDTVLSKPMQWNRDNTLYCHCWLCSVCYLTHHFSCWNLSVLISKNIRSESLVANFTSFYQAVLCKVVFPVNPQRVVALDKAANSVQMVVWWYCFNPPLSP